MLCGSCLFSALLLLLLFVFICYVFFCSYALCDEFSLWAAPHDGHVRLLRLTFTNEHADPQALAFHGHESLTAGTAVPTRHGVTSVTTHLRACRFALLFTMKHLGPMHL